MATVDLDAKRAARSEAENKPHQVTLGGESFELPPRLPLAFMDHLVNMEFTPAMRVLLGDRWEAFLAHGPDMDDLMSIAESCYGLGDFFGQGTASASPSSSANGGKPPSKTGRRTTTATSAKTATAPTTSGLGSS